MTLGPRPGGLRARETPQALPMSETWPEAQFWLEVLELSSFDSGAARGGLSKRILDWAKELRSLTSHFVRRLCAHITAHTRPHAAAASGARKRRPGAQGAQSTVPRTLDASRTTSYVHGVHVHGHAPPPGSPEAPRTNANLTFIMNKKAHLRPYHCVVLSLYLGYRVTHGARTSTTRATDGALRTPGDGSQGAHFTR